MNLDLTLFWAIIILIGITIYIVTDGFDLGVGILLPFIPKESLQDEFIDTIAPVWDGNETWLILGGAALMGAFPLAYAIILEAFTIPIVMMLFALIFRGVAFEFRVHSPAKHKALWTVAFIIGSYGAALMQGMMAGAYLEGFVLKNMNGIYSFAGDQFDWISPFSIATGIGLLFMYALIGLFWGRLKGNMLLANILINFERKTIVGLLGILTIMAIVMSFSNSIPLFESNIRLLTASVSILLIYITLIRFWIKPITAKMGFFLTIFIMVSGMIGYVSLFLPYVIPTNITLEMASSDASSQMFGLVGTLIMLPIIIIYLTWTYFVFRGKVIAGEGY